MKIQKLSLRKIVSCLNNPEEDGGFWLPNFNYTPAYAANLPQIDHVFPQSFLKKVKAPNPNTGKMDTMKYREADRNQLASCMLLTAAENGAGGKSDTPPEEWFADKDAA